MNLAWRCILVASDRGIASILSRGPVQPFRPKIGKRSELRVLGRLLLETRQVLVSPRGLVSQLRWCTRPKAPRYWGTNHSRWHPSSIDMIAPGVTDSHPVGDPHYLMFQVEDEGFGLDCCELG